MGYGTQGISGGGGFVTVTALQRYEARTMRGGQSAQISKLKSE
jgi:hypothetical protein